MKDIATRLKDLNTSDVRYIVLHCSATYASQDYTEKRLELDHKARGFTCGGYHYYVRKNGRVVQFRPLDKMGAHCKGYNSCSVAICYEGGLIGLGEPANTLTPKQIAAIEKLLAELTLRFPLAQVVAHHDLNPHKACPCFEVKDVFPQYAGGEEGKEKREK